MSRVLLIDDDQDLLHIAQTYLARELPEFKFQTAHTAQEAISKLKTEAFDALISDYQMPGMDGLELLEWLRKRDNVTPFIMFTGRGREEIAIQALNLGADHYLKKDDEPRSLYRELAHIIQRVIDHRKTTDALMKSEHEKALILSSTQDNISFQNRDLEILWANQAAAASVGMTSDQLVGRYCYEVWNQEAKPCSFCPVVKAIRTGESQQGERTTPDGRVWSIRGYPVRGETGEVVGAVEVTREITDQKRAEEALRDSEAKYRTLVEHSLQGLLVFQDNTVIFANSEIEKISGYSLEELSQLSPTDLQNLVHPNDREKVWGHVFLLLRGKTSPKRHEYQIQRKDGSFRWVEAFSMLIIYKGKVAVQASLLDITELKLVDATTRESEKKYRNLVEHSAQGIAILAQDRVLFANQAFGEIIGYSINEIRCFDRVKMLAILHPEDRERFVGYLRDRLAGKSFASRQEYRFIRKDGSFAWVESYASLIDFEGQFAVQVAYVDITERKQIQQALQKSEEQYRLVVENAGQAIAVVQEGKLVLVNPKATEITGFSEDELVSKPFIDLIHPDDQEKANERYLQRLRGEAIPLVYPFRIITKDGKVRWLEISAARITWEDQLATLNFLSDITEREQAEEALRGSEEQYRTLVEHTPLGITIWQDNSFVFVNPAFTKMVGYTEEEIIGFSYDEAWSLIYPADRAGVSNAMQKLMEGTPSRDYFEHRFIRKDGQLRWVQVTAAIIMYKGKQALQTLYEDISSRKQAEEALRESEARNRELLENLHEGVAVLNPEGQITFSNPRFAEMIGYNEDELVGIHWTALVPTNEHDKVQKEGDKRAKGLKSTYESFLLTKAGQAFPVIVSGSPLFTAEGGYSGNLGIFIDITERRQVAMALHESEEKYRMLVEQSLQGLVVLQNGCIVFANPAFEEITGYTVEELSALSPQEVRNAVHPGDQKIIWTEFRNQLNSVPGPSSSEFRFFRKDGDLRWVQASASRITFQGAPAAQGTCIDITERKQAENALQQSESRFKDIFASSPIGILLFDSQGVLIDANKALLDIFGVFDVSEMLGVNMFNEPNLTNDIKEVIEQKKTKRLQMTFNFDKLADANLYNTKRGGTAYFDVLITPLMDEKAEFEGYLVQVQDITESQRAEKALLESETKFRTLFQLASDPFMVVTLPEDGTTGHYIEVNAAGCQMLEYDREELLQMTPEDISTPDRRERGIAKEMRRKVRREGRITFEKIWVTKSGRRIPVEISAQLLRLSDKDHVLGIARDVTQRKKEEDILRMSEERFRTLVQNSSDLIVLVEADGAMRYVTPSTERLLGFPSKNFIGKNVFDYVHPEDLLSLREKFAKLVQQPGAEATADFRVQHSDGSWVYIGAIANNRLDDPRINGLVINARDISLQRQMEQALRESEELFRTIFEKSPIGIGLYDTQGFLIEANPTAWDIMGISDKAQFKDWNLFQSSTLTDKNLEEIKSDKIAFYQVLHDFDEAKRRGIATDKSGKAYLEIITTPLGIEGEKPSEGYILLVQDITERKKAALALQESEARFRLLMESLPIGIGISSLEEGCHIDGNTAVYKLLGYDGLEEFLEARPTDHYYNPEDRERYIKLLEMGTVRDFELQYKRKDGSTFWGSASATLHKSRDRGTQIIFSVQDISQRKQEEEILRSSESYYRLMFEASPISLWDVDYSFVKEYTDQLREKGITDFREYFAAHPKEVAKCANLARVVEVNSPTLEMYGAQTKEEFFSRLGEIFSLESLITFKEGFIALAEGKTAFSSEGVSYSLKGDKVFVNLKAIVAPGHEGRYSKVIFTNIDITDRKRTESELQLKNTLLEAQSETTIEGILVVDEEGKAILFNERFGEMWQIPPEILDTKDNEKMLQYVSDQVKDSEALLERAKYLQTHRSVKTRSEIEFKDGRVFDRYSAPLQDSAGNYYGRIWYFRDITDQRNSEEALWAAYEEREELEHILNRSPAMVFLWRNAEGWPVEFVSDNISQFGYTPEDFYSEEVLFANIIHPADLERIATEVARYSNEGHNEFVQEYRIITKSGEVRWLDDRTWVRRDINSVITHYQGIVLDITERKEAEEILKGQKQELSEFAHAMAHDLQNRLLVIESYALLMEERYNPSFAEKIHKNAQGIRTILRRSVDLADAGLVIEKSDNVNLDELIREVANAIIPEGVIYRQSTLPAVLGDSKKLIQVFQNLFENAITHGKSSKIEVRSYESEKGLTLLITNDGIPIPPENHSKIFQRGFTTKEEGGGRGLAIVQRILAAHNWTISLREDPETTFCLFIPNEE